MKSDSLNKNCGHFTNKTICQRDASQLTNVRILDDILDSSKLESLAQKIFRYVAVKVLGRLTFWVEKYNLEEQMHFEICTNIL